MNTHDAIQHYIALHRAYRARGNENRAMFFYDRAYELDPNLASRCERDYENDWRMDADNRPFSYGTGGSSARARKQRTSASDTMRSLFDSMSRYLTLSTSEPTKTSFTAIRQDRDLRAGSSMSPKTAVGIIFFATIFGFLAGGAYILYIGSH